MELKVGHWLKCAYGSDMLLTVVEKRTTKCNNHTLYKLATRLPCGGFNIGYWWTMESIKRELRLCEGATILYGQG